MLTRCPTHGPSGCLEVCCHIAEALDSGGYVDGVLLPVYPIHACRTCAEQHGIHTLREAIQIDGEAIAAKRAQATGIASIGPDYVFETEWLHEHRPDLLERLYTTLNEQSRLFCRGCLDQIRVDHARRTGATLPCEPWDHTIQNSDDPRITELRKLLLDGMNPRGNHGERFYGCTLFSGTALRPLRIEVYGVTTEEAQEGMLHTIDAFFAGQAEYQRRVRFHEPQSWEVETTPSGTRRTRLPHVLLREVETR